MSGKIKKERKRNSIEKFSDLISDYLSGDGRVLYNETSPASDGK